MALSGSFQTTAYNGRYLVFSWTATQSIPNNTSTISWTLKGAGGNSGYYKTGPIKVVIAGETVYNSEARINLYGTTEVASDTKVITHAANGTKSFSASVEAAIYTYAVNCTGSGSWDLNQIPRAATVTDAPNFNDEENPKVTYKNLAGIAVTSVSIGISSDGKTDNIATYRPLSKTETSYTFKFTDAERANLWKQVTSGSTAKVYFITKTVIGGNTLTDSKGVTLTLVNHTPTITASAVDIGGNSTQLLGAAKSNSIIKGFNVVQATINATGRKGATITHIWIRNGANNTVNSSNPSYSHNFTNVTDGNFYFNAIDSRGNYMSNGPLQITKEVLPWFKPTITLTQNKVSTGGVYTITVNGTYYNGSLGAANNALTVEYRWKVGSNDWGEWVSVAANTNENRFSYSGDKTGLDYREKYTVQARVVDSVGSLDENYITTTEEYSAVSVPVFDWGKNDFAFNVPISIEGQPLADFVVDEGTSGDWTYRKWNSGLAECWARFTITGVNVGEYNLDNMYYCGTKAKAYPFTFTSVTYTSATGGSTANMNFVRPFGGNNSQMTYLVVGHNANVKNATVIVNLEAKGRWK